MLVNVLIICSVLIVFINRCVVFIFLLSLLSLLSLLLGESFIGIIDVEVVIEVFVRVVNYNM